MDLVRRAALAWPESDRAVDPASAASQTDPNGISTAVLLLALQITARIVTTHSRERLVTIAANRETVSKRLLVNQFRNGNSIQHCESISNSTSLFAHTRVIRVRGVPVVCLSSDGLGDGDRPTLDCACFFIARIPTPRGLAMRARPLSSDGGACAGVDGFFTLAGVCWRLIVAITSRGSDEVEFLCDFCRHTDSVDFLLLGRPSRPSRSVSWPSSSSGIGSAAVTGCEGLLSSTAVCCCVGGCPSFLSLSP